MAKDNPAIYLINALLIILLLMLTPQIDNYSYVFMSEKGMTRKDVLYRVLGEARKIFSISSTITADVYFHGGFYPSDFERLHMMEEMDEGHSHEHEHEHGHAHICDAHCEHAGHGEHGRKTDAVSSVPRSNPLLRLGDMIHIAKHIHLQGEEEKEMLPWLYYAVRLDPHNINAYVVGGYWLGRRLDMEEEALKFLQEGLRNNPDSWEIYNEIGMLRFSTRKDYEEALRYFQKAKEFMGPQGADDYDKSRIYAFIAGCYDKLGQKEKAEEFFNFSKELFPERK